VPSVFISHRKNSERISMKMKCAEVAYHDHHMVTTCLENLEISGNLTAVREMSGKNLVMENVSKTVYCKLHICVHTGI